MKLDVTLQLPHGYWLGLLSVTDITGRTGVSVRPVKAIEFKTIFIFCIHIEHISSQTKN